MKFRCLVALCAGLLAGCAAGNLNKGLPYLVGKPLDHAIELFGLPDSTLEVGENTVYVWGTSSNFSLPVTSTNSSFTTGSVGSTPVYGTTTSTSTSYVPVSYNCTIKLSVDSSNLITYWSWEGNEGGCSRYGSKVKKLIPDD